MRAIGAAFVATSLLVSSAFAADGTAPLAAGKPAGVKKAALEMGGVELVGAIILAGGLIALVASTTQGHSTSSTGTGS